MVSMTVFLVHFPFAGLLVLTSPVYISVGFGYFRLGA